MCTYLHTYLNCIIKFVFIKLLQCELLRVYSVLAILLNMKECY